MSTPSRWSVVESSSKHVGALALDKAHNNQAQCSVESASSPVYTAVALVLSRLSLRELAQCRAVCKLWREAASSSEVRRAAFLAHWRLSGLVGEARNPALLETATLGHFVRRHEVRRGDSLTGLAVRHGCGVTAIMRLNNLISHHSLHSREGVFLPVSSATEVAGAHVQFVYCRIACRELLVLVSEEAAQAARREAAKYAAAATAGGVEEEMGEGEAGQGRGNAGGLRKAQEEALQGKLVALLGRSRQVDTATARFYLTEAGWCLKKALALYEQDMHWEIRSPRGRRRRAAPILPLPE